MKVIVVLLGLIAFQADPIDYKQIDQYLSTHSAVPIEYFDDLIKRDPASAYLTGMKIYFHIGAVGVDQATDWLEEYQDKYKTEKKFKTYLDLAYATILRSNGRGAESVALLQKALKEDPANKWLKLELYYNGSLDPGNATRLTSILKEHPDFGWAGIERIYQLDFRIDSAEMVRLDNSLPSTMKYWDFTAYMGEFYYFHKQYEKAKSLYEKSLEMGENAHALTGMGVYENEINGDVVKAEDYFMEAIAADSAYSWSYTSYGWLLFDGEQDEEAQDIFERGWRLAGDESCGREIVLFYLAVGNYANAKLRCDEMIQKFGANYVNQAYLVVIKAGEGEDITSDKAAYVAKYGQQGDHYLGQVMQMVGK